jgi:serine protease
MSHRWGLAALVLAPLLALGACDQMGAIWERVRGGATAPGPVALEEAPVAARALSGAVQPQSEIAALLAPEPVLVAAGEILVGARVESRLPAAAQEAGLEGQVVGSLRAQGFAALDELPNAVQDKVLLDAEMDAAGAAVAATRDVLRRLGVIGEVKAQPGGLVSIDLAPERASPTAVGAVAPVAAPPAAADPAPGAPEAMEWNMTDRCPRVVTQGQLEDDLALATRCAIERLSASRQFAFVEPNYVAVSALSQRPEPEPAPAEEAASPPPEAPRAPKVGGVPNDPLYALQWHYRARGAGQGASAGGAGFAPYWETSRIGSADVRVAVIDTGIDLDHPDIRASANLTSGVDMISNLDRAGDGDGADADAQDEGDVCGAAKQPSYHGTHVAGTIGAAVSNDRAGTAGGAWNVTIIPIRAMGRCGGELADIVSAIRWAVGIAPATINGQPFANRAPADIINMSLTIQAPCPASMQAAIDAATARNAVVVAAAGNKANQAALYAPANCNNVIVVSAGDARGSLAFYSNFGPQVDIVAPGGDVFADADSDGRPDGVLSTRTTRAGCYDPVDHTSVERCYYAFLQGTSMAAPHVSAALVLLAAETGLRGSALESALFARAVAPHPANFGQVECARSRNALPLGEGAALCARPSGRGALDLGRAAAQ